MNPNDSSNQNGHQQRKTFERKQDKLNRLLQELKEYSKDGDNLPSSNEQESSSSSPMCRNADENQNDVSNVSVFFVQISNYGKKISNLLTDDRWQICISVSPPVIDH